MTSKRRILLMALTTSIVFGTAALRAEGENVGDRQQCIPTAAIDETPVIDNRTILVKMKGKGLKRIDLVNDCSGLKIQGGFSYSTSTSDLCVTNTLSVLQSGAAGICMIKQIVTIDEAEAKALLSRR